MELTNLASLKRLSGLAFFKEDLSANWIPFGNILSTKLDTSPKTVSAMLNKRGRSILFRRDAYAVEPVFSLTSNQFSTSCMALMLMGTDLVQTSAASAVYSFTAAKGRAFILPYRGVTITSVMVSAAAKTLGTDFFVDDPNIVQSLIALNGAIILPETPAGIADGATVDVTYTRPALTREQYSAFTVLNRSGQLVVYGEDEAGTDANQIYTMNGQLSVKSVGELNVDKFAEVTFELAIFGNPTITGRPN